MFRGECYERVRLPPASALPHQVQHPQGVARPLPVHVVPRVGARALCPLVTRWLWHCRPAGGRREKTVLAKESRRIEERRRWWRRRVGRKEDGEGGS
eukprot:177725-Hanusia_phi.AAC.2